MGDDFSEVVKRTDAAVMCAATPTLTALAGSSCGPLVRARHPGSEQRLPTLDARGIELLEAPLDDR
jgi:hypothetical protein